MVVEVEVGLTETGAIEIGSNEAVLVVVEVLVVDIVVGWVVTVVVGGK